MGLFIANTALSQVCLISEIAIVSKSIKIFETCCIFLLFKNLSKLHIIIDIVGLHVHVSTVVIGFISYTDNLSQNGDNALACILYTGI